MRFLGKKGKVGVEEKEEKSVSYEESYYVASQWQLMWRKFRKHKLAMGSIGVLVLFYIGGIFCEFIAPYGLETRYIKYIYSPPQRLHFFDEEGFHLRPFVYGIKRKIDLVTLEKIYKADKTKKYSLYFLLPGQKYKLWNLLKADLHLFGVKDGGVLFCGRPAEGTLQDPHQPLDGRGQRNELCGGVFPP